MPIKIIVVDDEPDLELVIAQKFRKKIRANEYIFLFSQNGIQALELLDKHPDTCIIISDINMPEMDGLELLRRLKDLKRNDLKTIMVSAYSDMQNIRIAMNLGAFDFITKPVDFSDLETTIEKTISDVNIIREAMITQEKLEVYKLELEAAKEIQQAILPKIYPPFPDLKSFDICGYMVAAEQVGGDFFDYFMIDENRLGFVVGDVSGKGIPASIFMAVSRTLIHSFAKTGCSTNECLTLTNKILCNESANSMFVTVFYGILDINSGKVDYSNAGHPYPYILRNSNVIETIDRDSSVLLGVFDDANIKSSSFYLDKNEALVLFSDGVTEAMNVKHQLLGTDKLTKYLQTIDTKNPKLITDYILEFVKKYSENYIQSDDITILTVSYLSKE